MKNAVTKKTTRISPKKGETRKAKARGATRDTVVEEQSQIKWGRVFFLGLLLAACSTAAMQVNWPGIYAKAYQATNRPLANVKIEGEFRFVSKQELKQLISSKLDGSFVDLDLREVKTSIEKNPWIDNVVIERIWPDSLKLKINEHKPIARWNDDGYINNDGKLIKVDSNKMLVTLPLLSGEDKRSDELAKNYLVFTEILHRSGLRISGLSMDKKKSWSIQVEEAFVLTLGSDDIHGRLENFQYVFDAYLNKKKDEIDRVDMRYERGLAVKWKDASEFVAASTVQ